MKKLLTLAFAAAAPLCVLDAGALTILPDPPPAYELTYNAADGSLEINTFGNDLFVYNIKTTGDPLIDDGFLEENHTPVPGNVGFGGNALLFFTSVDDEISDNNRDGWSALPATSLGNVLPAGLTKPELDALLESATYVNAFGVDGQPEVFYDFNVVYVPEPTSFVLIGLGMLIILQRRRRDQLVPATVR